MAGSVGEWTEVSGEVIGRVSGESVGVCAEVIGEVKLEE